MPFPSPRRLAAFRVVCFAGLVTALATVAVPAVAQPFVPIVAADTSSLPLGLVALNGDLYYVDPAFSGEHLEVLPGGTPPAREIGPYLNSPFKNPFFVYSAAGNNLVYHASEGELWRSDGTAAGSYPLVTERASGLNRSTEPLTIGDVMFFDRDFFLWRSDGTPGGTANLGRELITGTDAAVFGGRLYFVLLDGRLFRTQGDGPGNGPYFDPPGDGEVRFPTAANERLYFFAQTAGNRYQLHDTRGGANARLVSPERFVSVQGARALGNRLFFFATGESTGPGLWVSDGNGALRLTGVNLGPFGDVETRHATAAGEFWWWNDSVLWRSDGTVAGTRRAAGLLPPARRVDRLFGLGDRLAAQLAGPGVEEALWLTDGTAEGTLQVGTFRDFGQDVVRLGDRIYFGAEGPAPTRDALYSVELADGPVGPQPPRNVRAEGTVDGVRVTFGAVERADRYNLEYREPFIDSPWVQLISVAAAASDDEVVLEAAIPGPSVPVDIRVQTGDQFGDSPYSETVTAAPVGGLYDCANGSTPSLLCLQNGRFHVEVWWRSELNGTDGTGTAVPFDFSDDSGTFWFFDADNIELVVKVLDARVINGNFWNFYGALSDVEYWVVVTDSQERTNVVYRNPPGDICGDADINAFPRPGLAAALDLPDLRGHLPDKWLPLSQTLDLDELTAPIPRADGGASGVCRPDEGSLCLGNDRFRVRVDWRDQRSGNTGFGRAIPGTSDSGYFWFFDPANVELVVKVLDGTAVNGFNWVFYGALTDVEYTLTVTDTATGATKEYVNPPGNICGDADVRAFD